MSTYRIAIIEDEMVIAATIAQVLKELHYEVVGKAGSFLEAVSLIERTTPDLLLLDIRINGSRDGIELAQYVNEHFDCAIIFLTANSDSATIERVKATAPLAYLVKPFQKEDLHTAIEIAMINHQRNLPKQKEEFIIFHSGKQTIKFKQLDILYIQSSENYAQLYLSDGQRKLFRATLKDIYSLLPTQHFVYINRSTIVNVHHITQITTDSVWLGLQSFNLSATMRKEVVKAWEGTNDK
jgi:two-component system response regulator LytT